MATSEVDTNLYSRQIGTYGMETMGKLVQMRVLIVGMRGLGLEVAKNIILAGPKSVTIHDDVHSSMSDLSANFYIKTEDVGIKTRAEASLSMLQELNSYVTVSQHSGDLDETFIKQFNLIVLTQSTQEENSRINGICRENGIGFISSEAWGVTGYIFVDFGPEFTVLDKDGNPNVAWVITGISNAEQGIVSLERTKRHGLGDGEFVRFREVEGMTEINDVEGMAVQVIDPYTLQIGDTSQFSQYTKNGYLESYKTPVLHKFKSYDEALISPVGDQEFMLMMSDMWDFGMAQQLHFAFRAIRIFQSQHNGELPELNNQEHAEEVCKIATQINQEAQENNQFSAQPLSLDCIVKTALYARAQISPMTTFFGSIIAQEIVKYTGKYTPIKQWLNVSWFSALPAQVQQTTDSSRYSDQIAIFGQDVQKTLAGMSSFMIGAGALGCEFLKGLAMMGVACDGSGSLTVTDDDNIETSNLNRQFLFRSGDIKSSKSEVACAAAKAMNQSLNVTSRQDRVDPTTEGTYNTEFWEGQSFILTAVDNVKARQYIDARSVWFEKTLFDSGTSGTEWHAISIIPHQTACYRDVAAPEPEGIPVCTLKIFPHEIEHCIEWGRDSFQGTFVNTPSEINRFLPDPQGYLAELPSKGNSRQQKIILKNIWQTISENKKGFSFKNCVVAARKLFQINFVDSIASLIACYPEDSKTPQGLDFWTGAKRFPQVFSSDCQDSLHLDFFEATAHLLADNYNIPSEDRLSRAEIAECANIEVETVVQEFDNYTEDNEAPISTDQDNIDVENLKKSLLDLHPAVQNTLLTPANFEKDDDSNFHIAFITAASNLRARNYRITEADFQKTKLIAGKIIPAIATTTALATSLILMEIYKLAQSKPMSDRRNSNVNLAIPSILMRPPNPVKHKEDVEFDEISCWPLKMYPPGFTIWDKIVVTGSLDLNSFLQHMLEQHGLKVTNVVSQDLTLLGSMSPPRGEIPIEDIFIAEGGKIIPGKGFLELEIASENESGDFIETPILKYTF